MDNGFPYSFSTISLIYLQIQCIYDSRAFLVIKSTLEERLSTLRYILLVVVSFKQIIFFTPLQPSFYFGQKNVLLLIEHKVNHLNCFFLELALISNRTLSKNFFSYPFYLLIECISSGTRHKMVPCHVYVLSSCMFYFYQEQFSFAFVKLLTKLNINSYLRRLPWRS